MRKVAAPTGLFKRKKIYWYRRRVPKEAVSAFGGRKEHWRSLETSDRRVADARLPQAEREFCRRVSEARDASPRAASAPTTPCAPQAVRTPSLEEMERILRAWLPSYLRRTDPRRGQRVDRQQMRADLEAEAVHLDACLFDGALPMSVTWLTQHLVEEHGFAVAKGSELWSDLVQLAVRAKLEAVRRELERLSNRSGGVHDAELFGAERYREDEHRRPANTISVGDAIDRFIAEKALSLKGKTIMLYRGRIRIIAEALGRDRPLSSVTRDDCRRVRDDVIMKLPAHFRRRFPEASIEQAITIAAKQNLPLYGIATQSLFVEVMATFFRWAEDQELIDRNPAKSLRLSRRREQPRKKFDTGQLRTLLSAPVFMGASSSSTQWRKPGSALISDHRYWVPLISLFSGMRLNEICQLLVSDVIEDAGILAFDICPSKLAGKSVKTKSGHRQIPIHPMLFELGFGEYLEAQRVRQGVRLFPDLEDRSETRSGSDKFSKWFARLLDAQGLTDPTLTFHSLRHTFTDALREAEATTESMELMMGWKSSSERGTYGSGPTMTNRNKQLSRVAYVGLDFDPLLKLTTARKEIWKV